MREITSIIIHCTATLVSEATGAADIRAMHLRRGWSDIGYHYVVRRDGWVETGRDLDSDGDVDEHTGAHAFGWNANSLGVALVGGVDHMRRGQANFTLQQMAALRGFLTAKLEEYPGAVLLGHRDTGARKDCPSFDVSEWWKTGRLIAPRNLA